MQYDPTQVILYKRSRFQSRLPKGRLYTASHFWLAEQEPGLWRVGFTRFATRMLGDLVEHGFEVKVGQEIKVGQTIGWVEGFKALTDLYSVADGSFAGPNPDWRKTRRSSTKTPIMPGGSTLSAARPRPTASGSKGISRCWMLR